METIAGALENTLQAKGIIANLLEFGINRDDIVLLMTEKARGNFKSFAPANTDPFALRGPGDVALGAMLESLKPVGQMISSGTALLATGSIVSALQNSDTAHPDADTDPAELLDAAGLSPNDANRFAGALKAGRPLLLVHNVEEEDVPTIRSLLSKTVSVAKAA